MLTTLLNQILMAIDLLGATAGFPIDLLRAAVLALTVIGVAALARVQRVP